MQNADCPGNFLQIWFERGVWFKVWFKVCFLLPPFSPFGKVERQEVEALFPRVVDACELWLREGVTAVMNRHNGQAQGKPQGGP